MAILAAFLVVFAIAYGAGYSYGHRSGTLETLKGKYERKDNND